MCLAYVGGAGVGVPVEASVSGEGVGYRYHGCGDLCKGRFKRCDTAVLHRKGFFFETTARIYSGV